MLVFPVCAQDIGWRYCFLSVVWPLQRQLWTTARRQPHSRMLITKLFVVWRKDHKELHNEVGYQSQIEHISDIQTGSLLILSLMSYPTVVLPRSRSKFGSKSIFKNSLHTHSPNPLLLVISVKLEESIFNKQYTA